MTHLLMQIYCITAGFTQLLRVLSNMIHDIKTTESKGHLLNNYLLNYAYCELLMDGNMGFEMDVTYIYTHTHTYTYVCVCVYIYI